MTLANEIATASLGVPGHGTARAYAVVAALAMTRVARAAVLLRLRSRLAAHRRRCRTERN